MQPIMATSRSPRFSLAERSCASWLCAFSSGALRTLQVLRTTRFACSILVSSQPSSSRMVWIRWESAWFIWQPTVQMWYFPRAIFVVVVVDVVVVVMVSPHRVCWCQLSGHAPLQERAECSLYGRYYSIL